MPDSRENQINHEMLRFLCHASRSGYNFHLWEQTQISNYPSGMTRSYIDTIICSDPFPAGKTMVQSMTTVAPAIVALTDIYSHDIS